MENLCCIPLPLIQWRSVSLTRFECQSDIFKVTRLQAVNAVFAMHMQLLLNSYFLSQDNAARPAEPRQEFNVNEWLEDTPEHLYGHLDS